MSPGSVVDNKMYKSIERKLYKNSLSSISVSKEVFVSKLKSVGLFFKDVVYKEYASLDGDISVLKERNKDRLIEKLMEAHHNKESVRFDSLIHSSKSGKPNSLLNADGFVRCCWRGYLCIY